jgi:hypothetical protein
MRTLIVGGPKTGKTTRSEALAQETGIPAWHADSLIDTHAWSEASQAVADSFDSPGPWIIEGVSVPRAIRKWLAAHPEGKPADKILVRTQPHVDLSPGQRTMTKGVWTVWNEVLPELYRRGVTIELDGEK